MNFTFSFSHYQTYMGTQHFWSIIVFDIESQGVKASPLTCVPILLTSFNVLLLLLYGNLFLPVTVWAQVTFYLLSMRLCLRTMNPKKKPNFLTSFSIAIFPLLPWALGRAPYIWNLERWYWWTYLQGSNGDEDIENRLLDMIGEGEKWDDLIE